MSPVPTLTQPSLLSYRKWCDKYDKFLCEIQSYVDNVFISTPVPPGFLVFMEKEDMYDSLFRYVYNTSASRFKRFHVIDKN